MAMAGASRPIAQRTPADNDDGPDRRYCNTRFATVESRTDILARHKESTLKMTELLERGRKRADEDFDGSS